MKRSLFGLLVYWLVVVIAIVCLTLWAAGLARASIADCMDATCRITAPDGSRGTGCVFERSGGYAFVLTCAHVVDGAPAVECEFWRDGHLSAPLPGRVTRVSRGADAAIVAVPESAFAGVLPQIIPVAPRDCVVRQGETLTSVGCANGTWSTAWKGHALGYDGLDLYFTPTPANGRSGSAIFNADGTAIVALLRARREVGGSYGIATSLQGLYRAFSQSRKQKAESRGSAFGSQLSALTQCPGGVCPSPPGRLSPYRYRQDQQGQRQDQRIGRLENTWPTLPAPSPSPALDLTPIGQKLDRIGDSQEKITELLLEIRHGNTEKPPVVPVEPAEDPAMKAAQEAKAEAAAVKAEVEVAKQESSKLRQAVNALIGDRETLKERFEARIAKVKEELGEDASKREIARAYVKDLAKEKLGDGTLGLTTGRLVGGALGLSGPLAFAIGLGLWLVSRRIGHKVDSGEPLLVQRLFDRVGDKIDALKDRLSDRDQEPATTARKRKAK